MPIRAQVPWEHEVSSGHLVIFSPWWLGWDLPPSVVDGGSIHRLPSRESPFAMVSVGQDQRLHGPGRYADVDRLGVDIESIGGLDIRFVHHHRYQAAVGINE